MPLRESPLPRRIRTFTAPLFTAALVFVFALAWSDPASAGFDLHITVNTTVDEDVANGFCSLHEAIVTANTNANYKGCAIGALGDSTHIDFNIGAGTPVINILSSLPAITDDAIINGNTGGATRVELHGFGGTNNSDDGLKIAGNADGSLVTNLVINNFGGSGILIEADNVQVTGSFIGTNAAGNSAAGNNTSGIYVRTPGAHIGGTNGTTPGGPCTGDCNLISGNIGFGGIFMEAGGSGAIVEGNFIGTDVTGNAAIPNGAWGVYPGAAARVGGTSAAARNVISGNTHAGIRLTVDALVEGNYIGSNAAGDAALPNEMGIYVQNATSAQIGDTSAGARNVISGNNGAGIEIVESNDTEAFGNLIGVAADGTSPLANQEGLRIYDGSSNNAVGGTGNGEANVIAFNRGSGVVVSGDGTFPVKPTGDSIRGNSIHDNDPLGISNEDGGNLELAPPVIDSVSVQFAGSGVSGTACVNCEVDVYSDDDGQGRTYEGTTTADGSGVWSFDHAVSGPNVTATANDAAGNTSEFSAPFTVPAPTPTPSPSPTRSPTPSPTGTPGAERIQGDVDCSGAVNIDDFGLLIRFAATVSDGTTPGDCPDVGGAMPAGATPDKWGDVTCDDAVDAMDALLVLAWPDFELPHPGCEDIGHVLA